MLPHKYYFYPNPYDQYAWTKCPKCDAKTKLRKFCLMVHYQDKALPIPQMFSIRADCKFCTECALIIKKKSEMEAVLEKLMGFWNLKFSPENYFIFGTMEMSDWKRNMKTPLPPQEFSEKTSQFIDIVDFKIQPAGWYFEGE